VALGPELLDLRNPLANLVAEEPLHGMLFRPELVAETVEAEEGDVCGLAFDGPRDPDLEIQEAWGMRQGGYGVALHRNRVLADLSIKFLAEDDNVAGAYLQRWMEGGR
jgi:hypothetical protein